MAETPRRLLVSITDAAEMIGVKRSSIYNLLKQGELESVKLGKRRLIRVDSLERYVERLSANQ